MTNEIETLPFREGQCFDLVIAVIARTENMKPKVNTIPEADIRCCYHHTSPSLPLHFLYPLPPLPLPPYCESITLFITHIQAALTEAFYEE